MSTPDYATYQGQPVQIRDTFKARPACAACGGDGYVEAGECPYCKGSGKESEAVEWAKVGLLTGPTRGHTIEVRRRALITITAGEARAMTRAAEA
jgi:DnaJ-class molecular chaperone